MVESLSSELGLSMQKEYTSDLIHNELISSYGFQIDKHFSSELKYEILKKYTKIADDLLDAGCANGLFTFAISNACCNVQGIDINQNFINLATQKKKDFKVQNVIFSFGDLEDIPFSSFIFDLVYSYSVLVLLENISKAISECVRVTKKDGIVILDITGKYNLSQRFWKKYYVSKGHFSFNALSWDEVKNVCAINNLKIIESHALGFLDQWKYLPLISRVASKLNFIDKIFHFSKNSDLDYKVSNLKIFKPFANRWYIVCQKI